MTRYLTLADHYCANPKCSERVKRPGIDKFCYKCWLEGELRKVKDTEAQHGK